MVLVVFLVFYSGFELLTTVKNKKTTKTLFSEIVKNLGF